MISHTDGPPPPAPCLADPAATTVASLTAASAGTTAAILADASEVAQGGHATGDAVGTP